MTDATTSHRLVEDEHLLENLDFMTWSDDEAMPLRQVVTDLGKALEHFGPDAKIDFSYMGGSAILIERPENEEERIYRERHETEQQRTKELAAAAWEKLSPEERKALGITTPAGSSK